MKNKIMRGALRTITLFSIKVGKENIFMRKIYYKNVCMNIFLKYIKLK